MAAITHAWHDLVHDMRDEFHDIATITKVDAARQAYLALWITLFALPLLFGVDKFIAVMSGSWEMYLASWVTTALPGTAATAVMTIGVVEILLAIAVLTMPRIGGDLLAVWMVLVAVSLFSVGGFVELGVAALALGVCALAMARMSRVYHHQEG
ncbi:hypothetical protein [Nocardioides limicola]|uniref:hypothetical protein n=1 Tax=Nocardioides limicola TaxID=2803368 RepID=UPI00193B144C|nr:hypothetical protein [Nocardioides sp. DJM-14]